jgi:hypothetical protein
MQGSTSSTSATFSTGTATASKSGVGAVAGCLNRMDGSFAAVIIGVGALFLY